MRKKKNSSNIFGALNGVNGLINNKFINLNKLTKEDLSLIRNTPGASLGSTRDKPDEKYCLEILKILKRRKINKFFYIGGNDSSDSLKIIESHSKKINFNLQCIHIPKTIDNDLVKNDHTPGFGSASKYVAQLFSGINFDVKSLPGVYLGIVMGRHAGFLAASSSLLREKASDGPHLVFIPECSFDISKFLGRVKSIHEKYGKCIISVSEGIQDSSKKLISQKVVKNSEYDAHGNVQLSGNSSLGNFLTKQIKDNLKISRVRSDTLGYPQRCFLGSASEVDQKEAFQIGVFASKVSYKNTNSFSAGILERKKFGKYKIEFVINSLNDVAGKTKVMSNKFYNEKTNNVSKDFLKYAVPLIGKKIIKTKSII